MKQKKSHSPENSSDVDWSDKKAEYPKLPFAFINLYQCVTPLFLNVGISYGIIYLYSVFSVNIFIQILLFPSILILNYWLYIWGMTWISKGLIWYYEKKSATQEGVFARRFENGKVKDESLHYYHLRGFVYKYPVWLAKKSIFPWMITYVLRQLGGNQIHKDFMYGDAYVGLELTDLQAGGVIMEGAIISSHVVDSLYGNLTIKTVGVEKNGVMLPNSVMAPGSYVAENKVLGPNSMVPKHWRVDHPNNNMIWGAPAKNTDFGSIIDLLPLKFQKQWKLKQKEY